MNWPETVEILHYKWCLFYGKEFNKDHIYMKEYIPDIRIEACETLIYCKVEKWIKYEEINGMTGYSMYGPIKEQGIRTVPVKREEMETI